MSVPTQVMRCGTHPEVLAVDTCARCGAFVCEACLRLIGEEPFCVACYARRDVTGRASFRALAALLCAVFGLFCLTPLSVVALVLVLYEKRAIAAGRAGRTSLPELRAAKWLAWIGIALHVVIAAALIIVSMTSAFATFLGQKAASG